jgi:hypothetical protein
MVEEGLQVITKGSLPGAALKIQSANPWSVLYG